MPAGAAHTAAIGRLSWAVVPLSRYASEAALHDHASGLDGAGLAAVRAEFHN